MAVEIAARAGFDWLLVDQEHGSRSDEALMVQCMAAGETPVLVRVPESRSPNVSRALDLGAAGIMFPHVDSAAEAADAVAAMRYPPRGRRGAARLTRAGDYGRGDWRVEDLLGVVQIESGQAVSAIRDIAAVDGVDVLFVGPLDLSVDLGCPGEMTAPRMLTAMRAQSRRRRQSVQARGTQAR
jgi:2-keto-3-deoxy-L-rhamnonate aldolase RhmA